MKTELNGVITHPVVIPDLTDFEQAPATIAASGGSLIRTENGAYIVTITTVTEQERAQMLLKDVRSRIKEGEKTFKEIKDPMNAAKDAVLKLEHRVLDPLRSMEKTLQGANSDFILAQQRAAREEGERLQRAEREKQLAESNAKIKELEARGEIGKAVSVAMEAEKMPVPVVAPVPVQLAKVATSRVNFSAEVVDFVALVQHCAANPGLISVFLSPNMPALNTQARTLKSDMKVPGVNVVERYV